MGLQVVIAEVPMQQDARSRRRERRAFPRVNLLLAAHIDAGRGGICRAAIHNISAEGAFCLCPKHLSPGLHVRLSFILTSPVASAKLRFSGHVLRSTRQERGFGTAIVFTDHAMQFGLKPQ